MEFHDLLVADKAVPAPWEEVEVVDPHGNRLDAVRHVEVGQAELPDFRGNLEQTAAVHVEERPYLAQGFLDLAVDLVCGDVNEPRGEVGDQHLEFEAFRGGVLIESRWSFHHLTV